MSSNPLSEALELALRERERRAVPVTDLYDATVRPAPDLFSNDYLSLCTNPDLRQLFLAKLAQLPVVFGTGGPRLTSGNAPAHIAFEARAKAHFRAPAALLFNSGFDANIAFWHAIPQARDAVVFDELVHASTRDGLLASRVRGALYPFAHNSVRGLREAMARAMKEHPEIAEGRATLFVAVESVYGMDGDFAPLPEMVAVVDELVPAGCSHIVVDEAHSTGIYGPEGRGLVHALGLEGRIDTVAHSFGKARALVGGKHGTLTRLDGFLSGMLTTSYSRSAVLLTSPVIRKYIINYGRPFIFSTSLPTSNVCALETTFDYIESPAGEKVRHQPISGCVASRSSHDS